MYETTNYDVFRIFTDRFEKVLAELNSLAAIDFVTQVGLRYVDVIRALDGFPPNWFIRERFQGFDAEEIGANGVRNQFLSLIETSQGMLKVKSDEGMGPEFMPRELRESRLDLKVDMAPDDHFRTLDYDHIWKGEIDFIPHQIIAKMKGLHDPIKQVFNATVKEDAITAWKSKGDQQHV